jgi:predicted ABC-type ATPase
MARKLYIICGCNGAGKTTASYTILPEILHCNEFVNADEIAKGLSPFQPESAHIAAGRLMIERIKSLMEKGEDFAFETTLATKSYQKLIERAKKNNYHVEMIYFWLNSMDLAINRVKIRVSEGGHGIPEPIIKRRYNSGLKNFFNIYLPIVDTWMFIDNSSRPSEVLAQAHDGISEVFSQEKWDELKQKYHD